MQKLVWQNAKGEELDLTGGNYGITEWEGFSNTGLNIQSQQVPFQDGGVFLDALIDQRELTITLAIQDKNNLTLRYQQRRELISALNPKLGEGYLIYTNDFISKRIKCIPQIPIFETHNSDMSGTPKATLSWTACEPYWEDLEETEVHINSGITVRQIENTGDVSLGLEIVTTEGESHILIENQQGKKIDLRQKSNITFPILDINTNVGKKGITGIGLNISQAIPYTITTTVQDHTSINYPVIKAGSYYFTFINAGTGDTYIFIKSENLTEWTQVGNSQSANVFGMLDNATKMIYDPYSQKIYILADGGILSTTQDMGATWTHENTNYTAMCLDEKNEEVFFSELGDIEQITETVCAYNPVTQEIMEAYRSTVDEENGLLVRIHRDGEYFETFHEGIFYNLVAFVNTKGQYIIYATDINNTGNIVLDWNGGKIADFYPAMAWIEREDGYYGVYNVPFATANSGVSFVSKDFSEYTEYIQSFPHHTNAAAIENEMIVFDVDEDDFFTTSSSANNYISCLSSDSDMTLGLEIGNNTLSILCEGSLTIKYRQKYIGV